MKTLAILAPIAFAVWLAGTAIAHRHSAETEWARTRFLGKKVDRSLLWSSLWFLWILWIGRGPDESEKGSGS